MPGFSLLYYALARIRAPKRATSASLMIENIRKYTGLMVLVFVLLFAGLVFMDFSGSRGYGSGKPVLQAHGRGYTELEYRRRGESPARALQQFASPQSFEILEFLQELGTPPNSSYYQSGVDYRRFLVNRINLQNGAKEFGIHISDEEIDEYIRERLFVNQQGTFNAKAYDTFVKEGLASLGMGPKDFYEILGDVLAYGKLREVISSGISPNQQSVREAIEGNQQRVSAQSTTLELATFETKQDPSTEEVKKFWEENKGKYLSDPRRRISYIVAKPDYEPLLEKLRSSGEGEPAEKADPSPPETGGELGEGAEEATEPAEAEEDAPAPPAENPAAQSTPPPVESVTAEDNSAEPAPAEITPDSLSREEKESVIKQMAQTLEGVWDELDAAAGEGFENVLKENGFEVRATELVSAEDLPDEFAGTLFGKQTPTTGSDEVFKLDFPGQSLMDRISFPIRVGDNWILFRVDESEDAAELDFEAAKEDARVDLVSELGREALEKAAEETRVSLAEAVAAGTAFEQAAKDLELEVTTHEEVTYLSEFDEGGTPRSSQEIFQWMGKVNPGEVSEVLMQDFPNEELTRALIAYVEKRELVESDELQGRLEQAYRGQESRLQSLAFTNWLAQKYAASGVTYPGQTLP